VEKEELLDRIVELEYEMFDKLKTKNEECKRKGTFALMRKSRFYPLSEGTLKSYIHDLEVALLHNQNLLAVKYKCIELGSFVKDELVEEIVKIEVEWMRELKNRYPHIIENKIEDFERYLRCELLTFSSSTLESYYMDVKGLKEKSLNMAEISYLYLFKRIGYNSLEEVENSRK
jgi:hypothetical protein